MTVSPPCRLWEVGAWREVKQLGGEALCFSPDGRLVVVKDASKVIRLVDTETAGTLARFDSPDACDPAFVCFSPDGSRLVVTTNLGPAVHVWDLRTIRKQLAGMGLDWDAPPCPDLDPAGPSSPPLPPLRVDLGPLAGHSQHFTVAAKVVLQRYTSRLNEMPDDADALHHRAHALHNLKRFQEAINDLNARDRTEASQCPFSGRPRASLLRTQTIRARDRRSGGRACPRSRPARRPRNPGYMLQSSSVAARQGPQAAARSRPRDLARASRRGPAAR